MSPSFGRQRLSDGYGLAKNARKSVVEVSLESRLETLKRKYTSTGKDEDKPTKPELMPPRQSVPDIKRTSTPQQPQKAFQNYL